jgi:hypothetical protein
VSNGGRRPDYTIACLNKETDEKGDLGAAWSNEDGRITLVFNPFVVVPVGSQYVITLFKRTYNSPAKPQGLPSSAKRGGHDSDEIPF